MDAKCYRALQRAQGKTLREYFSGMPFDFAETCSGGSRLFFF